MGTVSSENTQEGVAKIVRPVFYRLIIPLSIILFLLVGGFTASILITQQQSQSRLNRHILSDALYSMDASLVRNAGILAGMEDILLNDPHLREALQARDRDRLLALYGNIFETLREKYAVTHFYFHLPYRVNLLRVHKPEIYGDRIDRFTAREAERTGKTAWGIELGPLGTFTLRVVQPVRAGDTLIGYLELGQEIEGLLKLIHQRLGVELAVTIHKNVLDRQKWVSGMKMLGRQADWDRYGAEALIYFSQPEFPSAYDSFIRRNAEHGHGLRSEEVRVDNKSWQVFASPLKDVSGTDVGDILLFRDITEAKRAFFKLFTITASLGLLLLSGLYVFFYVILRHTDKNILVQQAKLAESEKRHRFLLDAVNRAGIYLFVVDEKYRVRYMNRTMIEGFGEVVGKLCYRDVAGYDAPCPHCRMGEVIDGRKTVHYHASLANGCSYKMIAVPYIDVDGSSCKLEIMQDITKQKRVEEEKKILQEKLLRAQKMEAIGLLAGGVAHDLNNILSGIVSYPELLLLNLPEDSEMRKPLMAIQESGNRAAAVVDDLLTVARGVACVKESHDLNTLVEEYLHSPECNKLKSLYPHVTCRQQLSAPHPYVACSPVHIKKSLMNLVTNAAEAIVNEGTIFIETHNHFIDGAAAVEYLIKAGEYVVLTVRDTGPGISDKHREHIFEPFYTKKKMGRSGTGLGLSVVFNTVQDHGGKIMVTSSSEGTCFTLYFPASKGKEFKQTENFDRKNITGKGEHILVIDDEPQLRDIACQILKTLGYRVDSVCSGELAVTFVQEHPVDVLVIDMLMEPGMNGRQTYEEILKQYPGQKAVIASGFSENDEVRAALQSGVVGFIKKPYSMMELGWAVKAALSHQQEPHR